MKLSPDVLDAALEIDPGIAHLTVGEQYLAVNCLEARILVRLQVKKTSMPSNSSSPSSTLYNPTITVQTPA